MPRDHGDLRREVCDSLMDLPQTKEWIKTSFNNSNKEFLKFIEIQRRVGTWTDDAGIMCQATALFLGNINLSIKSMFVKQLFSQGGISSLWALPTEDRNSHSPSSSPRRRRINCWGPGWGEQGYYRLFYCADGSCSINTLNSSAIVV